MTTRNPRPDPLDFRPHRTLENPTAPAGQPKGTPSDGMALANGIAVVFAVALAGCVAARLRWKSSCAGVLSFRYMRPAPNDDSAYTGSQPADVAAGAGVEATTDFAPVGEGILQITFTPGADGTLTYADFSER